MPSIACVLSLLLYLPHASSDSVGRLSEAEERRIDELVGAMTLKELLGQTLMLGYNPMLTPSHKEQPGKGLRRLIDEFSPGSLILFKRDIPYAANERDSRAETWRLTESLQKAAYDSQPDDRKVPLIIATDQEGGPRIQITRGITRTPSSMYIGATRSPDVAKQAGQIIGTELKRLGINTILAPVADINNNDKQDIVGKRSFGAHKRLVAPMAVCFMQGLQEAKVLSIAKHYPGHGDTGDDPHFVLPRVRYANAAYLRDWDLYPFRELIEFGVNGLMTAHLQAPALDDKPVTVSEKAIDELRQREPRFGGIVVTDDIGDMIGILSADAVDGHPGTRVGAALNEHYNQQRFRVIKDALNAGTDVVMLAHLYRIEYGLYPERSTTVDEFRKIYDRLMQEFSAARKKHRLKEAVKRILRQKANLVPLESFQQLEAWQPRLNETDFRRLRGTHEKMAQAMPRGAVIQITDYGNFVNNDGDSTLFGGGAGPLSRGRLLKRADQRLLIVSPVFKEDKLTELIKDHPDRWFRSSNIATELLIYGWKKATLDDAEAYWKKQGWTEPAKLFQYRDGQGQIHLVEENLMERSDELIAAAKDASAVVFGIVTEAQIAILDRFLRRVDLPVIVLLFKEPYFVPPRIYEKPNVSVIFAPAFPDESIAVDALFGRVHPRNINYLPFNIPGKVRINVGDSVHLEPTEICELKNFADYVQEASREFMEAQFQSTGGRKTGARNAAERAREAADRAHELARDETMRKRASSLYREIDSFLLNLRAP